ncbi:MAG: RNA 2',3'-cyclic phosphodiesterase [Nitrospirales bacterium]|nr:RNA 2',3'-cyclic phosphodiesterase [Nitrospirales bacterium]
MRLFVALDPPEEIKQSLLPLLETLPAGRPSNFSQLHLTLFFLGNVADEDLNSIKETLAEIKEKSFTLQLKGVGCFPNIKRPRVLWVGIPLTEGLSQLKVKIDQALQTLGFQKEDRAFHPHLTLSRIKKPHPKGVEEYLNKNFSFQSGEFPVKEFYLFQSQLTPKGSIYTKLAQFPLF